MLCETLFVFLILLLLISNELKLTCKLKFICDLPTSDLAKKGKEFPPASRHYSCGLAYTSSFSRESTFQLIGKDSYSGSSIYSHPPVVVHSFISEPRNIQAHDNLSLAYPRLGLKKRRRWGGRRVELASARLCAKVLESVFFQDSSACLWQR